MTAILEDENGNVIHEPAACKYCGKIFDRSLHYGGVEDGSCSTCQFWRDRIAADRGVDKDRFVVVNGRHYTIGDEPTPTQKRIGVGLGFGGSEFRILFNDGRRVTTHNLWHQGTIPERWRSELPDNAVFENERR